MSDNINTDATTDRAPMPETVTPDGMIDLAVRQDLTGLEVTAAIRDGFKRLSTKEQRAITARNTERAMAALMAGDAELARQHAQLAAVLAGPSATEVAASRIATLRAAIQVVWADAQVDGVELTDELVDSAPVNDAMIRRIRELVSRENRESQQSGSRGPRAASRDVGAHIRSALAASSTGRVSVADIVRHRSTEYGPDSAPTSGAVNANLFVGTNAGGDLTGRTHDGYRGVVIGGTRYAEATA